MKWVKRSLRITCVLVIPVLFFLNTWQSFRYATLKKEIRRLENAQAELVEENKRRIIAIAILDFPARIRMLAEQTLGLKPPAAETYIEIRPAIRGRNSDG